MPDTQAATDQSWENDLRNQDVEKLLAAAALPLLPWPVIKTVSVKQIKHRISRWVGGKHTWIEPGSEWTFHYDDGNDYVTRDPVEAEKMARLAFPNGPPKNT